MRSNPRYEFKDRIPINSAIMLVSLTDDASPITIDAPTRTPSAGSASVTATAAALAADAPAASSCTALAWQHTAW